MRLRARRLVGAVTRRGWRPYPAAVEVPCALCGGDGRHVVARRVSFGMRYTTVACDGCGLVFISPRPTEEAFRHFYAHLYPLLYPVPSGEERGDGVYRHLAAQIDLSAHEGVLDIGCRDAAVLLTFARLGYGGRLRGCDPGWRGGTVAGVVIDRKPVEELDAASLAGYSLFLMYDVLEHLLHPARSLRALHDMAPDGSVLFVSTSCIDNWQTIPPAGLEDYYLRLAHTYTFSEATLDALLAVSGWQVDHRVPAPKGDQWVTCRKAAPAPARPREDHPEQVLTMIESYRERSRAQRAAA